MTEFFQTRKTLFFILLAAVLTVGVIAAVFRQDSKVNQANLELLRAYGWEAEETPVEITRLSIPWEFDLVYETYNQLAREGGYDLTPYKGARATRYTYRILNHADSGTGLIRANVFVTRSGIIAADLCSLAPGGFLRPITDTTGQVDSL